ncbi:50S ribosomal protein L6 [Candidatus Curtissbacteria bacterium RBG_16_39_7]|uniref:Large ribosomal subunit protein uL6 n=1 Tax=Candidatus Curtissbacteria bacterium RBG_16_39_7 TaxID=1797707 RepID=A0A1F5G1Q0_9BACT|nr:MAG: 50S ribosomal protein L6 [Candidatus Curtissbacteria bacterium RBG_16_39_7]
MSRIGKIPVKIPEGVTVEITDHSLAVSGPLGTLSQIFRPEVKLVSQGDKILVEQVSNSKLARSLHGLTRTLISNMILGVISGWDKELELFGVGYRARTEGSRLILSLGFSHPVEIIPPPGIKIEVSENKIKVSGIDKALVGQVAAEIRNLRQPDPYKGKGIRYSGESIKLKTGKKTVGIGVGK